MLPNFARRLFFLALLLFVWAGCQGPIPAHGSKPGTESREQIVVMEASSAKLDGHSLYWTFKVVDGKATRAPDGRLEVTIEMENRIAEALGIQVQTVFKGEDGVSTGDETNWEVIVIPGYATYTYRITSANDSARDFLTRIRRPVHGN